jgi:hypothetical protein
MVSPIQKNILTAITNHPGIRAAELGRLLSRDRNQCRKAADLLVERGYAARQDTGNGWAYFPVGTAVPDRKNALEHQRRDGAPVIIDADFREIPSVSSDSRALVVHGAAQPTDNRIAGAVAAADKARRRQGGTPLPAQYAASMNSLYELDATGERTLAALALAEVENARRQLVREQQEAASRAIAVQAHEPTSAEVLSALGLRAFNVWSGLQDNARARAREEWEARQSSRRFVEEDRFAARRAKLASPDASRTEGPGYRNARRLADLLRANRKVATPPDDRSSWFERHFGAPRKAVWR